MTICVLAQCEIDFKTLLPLIHIYEYIICLDLLFLYGNSYKHMYVCDHKLGNNTHHTTSIYKKMFDFMRTGSTVGNVVKYEGECMCVCVYYTSLCIFTSTFDQGNIFIYQLSLLHYKIWNML